MFYPEIVNRYLQILRTNYYCEPKMNPDYPFTGSHLMWMLETIRDSSEMSETKKHRWLGFVQGVLSNMGILSVPMEREITRNIFNGE